MLVELLDRRLLKPQPAVVAVQARVAQEGAHRIEPREISVRRQDLKVRALPQVNGRSEVADGKRDGLAEVTVGRIADQTRARVGVGVDDHETCGDAGFISTAGSTEMRSGVPVRALPP